MVEAKTLLAIFLGLKIIQHLFERCLSFLNRRYYLNPSHQNEAKDFLGITKEDLDKTLAYSTDKFRFGKVTEWIDTLTLLIFLALGGLGLIERISISLGSNLPLPSITVGLFFFGIMGFLGVLLGLPFEYYYVFTIEEKHGFNRQTPKEFFKDKVKGLLLGILLGGPILIVILAIMSGLGKNWWFYAWLALSFFSIFMMWIYPTFIAPIFNKFEPLPDGELKEKILTLSKKVEFQTSGLFVMDASKRSAHGNAYFTGLFGKRRIVLFDTLIKMLETNQIVAVLAHELGHFRLHHIRYAMIREIFLTGLLFYLLSLCLPLEVFYDSFHFQGVSNYGALVVFGLWFGPVGLLLKPFKNGISRRNEFAADRFSIKHMGQKDELRDGLLKLREESHSMPITHPVFSLFYLSHPPILERLKAM